ncbi:6-carboxytetrahydropterin synthase QueD [Candidatus Woesearchaeota archaeon]|nr:6-carboxytetrahydropterin synthase QueD [Candidatus Woesearchaeota archaeon]
MIITKAFEFDAAHNLLRYKGKCERLHGHTYRAEVSLEGEPDDEGMVEDFAEIKKVVGERVLKKLDHAYINDVIKQPTAENIAIWIWNELKGCFKRGRLCEVKVYESRDSWAAYNGQDD